jgi:phosphate transport system ATP-binding protein
VTDVLRLEGVTVSYGAHVAVRDVTLAMREFEVMALLGASGCGKTTVLRTINRMTDLVPDARVEGRVLFRGEDVYAPSCDPIAIRRRIGMVFQKPNVFPGSIFDNVAYGPRIHRMDVDVAALVEESLARAGLWDEVRGDLRKDAHTLSGGQQQRLVIARALALAPEVLLMDEPSASLDPIAKAGIEALMTELASDHTVVVVTHDLELARRVADRTAFLAAEADDAGVRHGRLVEAGPTAQVLSDPVDPRTRDFLRSRG